jgi:hypothetical protein
MAQIPLAHPVDPPTGTTHEERPDRRGHGVTRLPVRHPAFDLQGFRKAWERRDLAYQLARYAPDADIRIVDPDHPPSAPRHVCGTSQILSWLLESEERDLDPEVTQLIDGGDRFAVSQRWHYADGTSVVAVSTAELQDALITTQHTIVTWVETPN